MGEGRIITRYALLGICYFLAASATIAFTRFDEGVSCLWVATGILVAVLVSTPRRTWKPALVACGTGSFFATGIFGLGWLGAFAFVAVNLIEAMVVAWLLKRHISGVRALGSLDWFERFLFAAGIVGPLAGATIAASWFLIMGIRVDPVLTFLQFFAGHALGNLTITPMAMLVGTAAARRSTWKQLTRNPRRTLTVMMLVAFVAAAVFSQQRLPLMFLPIVPIILACFRTGREGAALAVAILALVGGLLTALGQGPIQMLNLGVAGRIFYFQLYLAATVLTVLPISADLTNRRYLHRRLRDSEWRLRLITDFSTDIIFKLDADGTIRYVTPSVRQLGYSVEELVGRNCAMLVDPRDLPEAQREHWRTVELGGAMNRFEYRARGADDSCHWFESHARMIVNDRGEYEGMVSIARNTSDRKATESRLRTAALTDPLTGLPNRRAFRDHAAERLNAAGSGDSIAVLDIDHFKRVNDRYGHEAGDEVLRAFSDIARRIIRDNDFIARMGGEEFAILFPDTSSERARFICERLRLELAGAIIFAGISPVRITVSGGVAALGANGIDHALKTADEALYRAKEDGRDRLTIAA